MAQSENQEERATAGHNGSPDVVVSLTHAQATFVVENCDANINLCLKMIMQIGEDFSASMEEKQRRAAKFVEMNDKFVHLRWAMLAAGAKEPSE